MDSPPCLAASSAQGPSSADLRASSMAISARDSRQRSHLRVAIEIDRHAVDAGVVGGADEERPAVVVGAQEQDPTLQPDRVAQGLQPVRQPLLEIDAVADERARTEERGAEALGIGRHGAGRRMGDGRAHAGDQLPGAAGSNTMSSAPDAVAAPRTSTCACGRQATMRAPPCALRTSAIVSRRAPAPSRRTLLPPTTSTTASASASTAGTIGPSARPTKSPAPRSSAANRSRIAGSPPRTVTAPARWLLLTSTGYQVPRRAAAAAATIS